MATQAAAGWLAHLTESNLKLVAFGYTEESVKLRCAAEVWGLTSFVKPWRRDFVLILLIRAYFRLVCIG